MPWPQDNLPINPYSALPVDVVSRTLDLMGMYLGIPVPGATVTPLLSRAGPVPNIGPVFWIGDSWEDEQNEATLASIVTIGPSLYSDRHSWAYLVNTFLGQNCVGRFTSAGASPFGQNYAIGGFAVANMSTMTNQLLSDYPTLPANSLVVIALGINDINLAVNSYGGVWQTSPQTWTLGASGGFTIPASGNFTITVVSTTGMVAAPTNGISFQVAGVWYGPFYIQNVLTGTTVSISTVPSLAGGVIPNNAPIKISGAAFIDSDIPLLSAALTSILAHLPASGQIVVVSPPNTGLLPGNASTAALSTATWNYWRASLATNIYTATAKQVAGWDINGIISDIFTAYAPTNNVSRFGFKTATVGWGAVISPPSQPTNSNPNDFVIFDSGFHLTGATHALVASNFLNDFFIPRAYLSVY